MAGLGWLDSGKRRIRSRPCCGLMAGLGWLDSRCTFPQSKGCCGLMAGLGWLDSFGELKREYKRLRIDGGLGLVRLLAAEDARRPAVAD